MTWKRKRRLYFLLVALVLLGLGVLAAKLKMDAIDAEAQEFAETGKAAIALFGEYQEAIAQLDLARLLACYDPAYASPDGGEWRERLASDRDGIQVYEWYVEK